MNQYIIELLKKTNLRRSVRTPSTYSNFINNRLYANTPVLNPSTYNSAFGTEKYGNLPGGTPEQPVVPVEINYLVTENDFILRTENDNNIVL